MADASSEALVTALLLNYGGTQMTLQCVADLLDVKDVCLRIVVHDNGSGQQEVSSLMEGVAAMELGQHEVEVIALGENLGFTGGMNKGFELAKQWGTPFVLVLNNDMRLPSDFLRPLVNVMQSDDAVGAVGPTVVHPDGTVWAEGGELGFAPNGLRLIRHGKQPSERTQGPKEVGFLTGACMLLRLQAVQEIGGFDNDYFMYWEDVALCDQLYRRGHRVIWLPWVRVEHLGGQSSGGGRSPLRKYFMACNAVRFLRTRGTAKGWLGWLLFDLALWPITLLLGPRAAWAKLRGMCAGICGHRADAADVSRILMR